MAHAAERSVWVAVRARPLVARERLDAEACVTVNSAAGVVRLGSWRQFTYDHAFGPEAQQQDVYAGCVSSLVDSVLEGYNATVLAYGPTCSGKTHTMGMGRALHTMAEHHGIIPRVIKQLFDAIAVAPSTTSFVVKAQFLEIYNEELRDLLSGWDQDTASPGASPRPSPAAGGCGSPSHQRPIAIRECPDGQIMVTGAREVAAGSAEDLLRLLDAGTLTRATSGTLLNEQSSRSHAIFSIILEQSISSPNSLNSPNIGPSAAAATSTSSSSLSASNDSQTPTNEPHSSSGDGDAGTDSTQDADRAGTAGSSSTSAGEGGTALAGTAGAALQEYRISKFHLVDLAGSERVRRVGVTAGMRFKETVNINQGLLALGNVISALSDGERRPRHVPYRDSKLTRLLQDSLGGNSKTLMIVCVSSADDAVEETLNTLKYAQRARTIRNRPVLNRQCLGEGPKAMAAEIQALQLALLRRFTLQMQGASRNAALPGVLMRDAAAEGVGKGDSPIEGSAVDASHKCVRMLQELQAMAASDWPLQLSTDASTSSDQQLRPLASSLALQQLADLESKVLSANNHITRLELELDVCAAERQVVQQAAGVLQEQQVAAWDALLQEVQSLHDAKQLSDSARQRMQELAQQQKQLPRLEGLVTALAPGGAATRASLHSHPLPEEQSSIFEQVAAGPPPVPESIIETSTLAMPCAAGVDNEQRADKNLSGLQAELAQKTALLQVAQGDLSRDEQIFADKAKEVELLQAELAAAAARAQCREEALEARLQHVQADMRRWRARALAVQQPADQQQQGLPSPPSSWHKASPPGSPSPRHTCLQPEISFAAGLPKQQQLACSAGRSAASSEADVAESEPAGTQEQQQQQGGRQQSQSGAVGGAVGLPPLQLDSSMELATGHLRGLRTGQVSRKAVAASEDDQVLFDADLLSYISDTDYTDLRCADFEVDNHLLAELQVVLADKAALEEEKAAAQAEAAAAQRAFEHAHAMLEGQLNQLSSAINSQEALIATLQANEAEAKNLGALYLERCRELEAQLAELNLDLEELTSEMARVEADAAASAGEKQQLRREYEAKLAAVAGLQQQMKQQDGARVEKERQRASSRVQQLQAELSSMRSQQDSLRQRLQERLTAQEKDSAAKARELSSLRRAAEAAKKRVADLEAENRRQRAALRARSNEAATAQRQLRELASRLSPVRSRPGQSPMTSPRTSSFELSPQPSLRTSAGTASPRTPAARTSPRGMAARTKSPARCRTDSPQQQSLQQQHQQQRRRADPGYAAHYASRIAGQDLLDSGVMQHTSCGSAGPQQKPAGAAGTDAGPSNSSSCCSGSRQMLTKQVALLVSECLAKHRLKVLQSKQDAVQARRDGLLATKAQLELKQLRRCQNGGPGRGSSSNSSRGQSGGVHADTADATGRVLLSDLTDQLDAVGAQLQHLEHLMRKAAADAASAAGAAAELHHAAADMTQEQLHELLGLALKELALQAAECQETVAQVKRLQAELSDTQQQLHEASCCLQMAQLQHQAQLSELQREHERRLMGLLRQLPGTGQGPGGLPAGAGACDETAAAASGQVRGAGVPAGAAREAGNSDDMHTQQSRLVGLLQVLAQQGTEQQQQKLLGTLARLQQVHQAQQGHQQQQQQQQHTRLHIEQLQRLKQCRLQQRLEQQQQQRQHDVLLSPRLQQPQLLCPVPAEGAPLQQLQHQQHEQQPLSPLPQQLPAVGTPLQQLQPPPPPQQQQQQQQPRLLDEPQVSPQATTAAVPAQSATCDALPSESSSGSSDDSDNGTSSSRDSDSDSDSSSSSAGLEEPVVLRRTSTQSAASAAGSLRASATRLQAKLCSYRRPSSSISMSACSNRILGGSDAGGCGQLRSSSSVLIGSPRAPLGGGGITGPTTARGVPSVLATAQSLGGSNSPNRGPQGSGVQCSAAVPPPCGEAGAAGDCAADMLRRAAQLAMRSSVEAARRSSSGGPGGRGGQRHSSSSGSSSGDCALVAILTAVTGCADELRGSGSVGPGRMSNCSGSSLRCSSDGGGLQQQQQPASGGQSVAAAPHRHRSSDDCLRPPSLDVSCSSVHHPGGRRHHSQGELPSSSSSNSSSGGGSCRKASSPAPAFCRALAGPREASGAGADDLDALPAAGLQQQQPRSPYQAFKASAAAAAGRDQHPGCSSSSPGGVKSRRGGGGVPATSSSPSAYMKLLQGLD